MKHKLAIIDLGSNSVRMNIMGINENGGYSVYDQAKEMVRLSEGLDTDGLLKEEPIQRTIKALRYFRRLLTVYEVSMAHVFALSTAAVRAAKNQRAFLERVTLETGFDFRVLSGEEEAYYDYLGVVNGIQFDDAVLVDIGGGSTEVILVKDRVMHKAISLPYGSVILTEHFRNETNRKKQCELCQAMIDGLIDDIPWLEEAKGMPIIGLGGIIRTLGKVDRNLNRSSDEFLHDYVMKRSDAESIFKLIQDTETKDMDKIEGISKRRADLMPMGIMPIKGLVDYLDSPEIRISGNGLREGFFYEYFFGLLKEPVVVDSVLRHSKYNMMKLYSANSSHAIHVKNLALQLFDKLSEIHKFDKVDRLRLSVAAMLHDIGMHIGYYDHHVHGMYLMMNSRLDGMTREDHMAVAFLVGNHRESQLKDRVKYFQGVFNDKQISHLKKLSTLLQMAEQLDRSLTESINNMNVKIDGKKVFVKVEASEFPELDVQSVMRFADRFEKSFNYALNVYY